MTRRIASILKGLCGVVGIFLTQPQTAHAFDLGILGNMNMGSTAYSSLTSGLTAGSATGFGAAVLLAHDLFPTIKGEFGLMYLTRGGTLTSASGSSSTASYNYLMIPYTFRFEPVSLLSVGLGGYYAYGIGNVTINSTISGLSSGSSSYESQNQSRSDFGLLAGVSLKLPLAPLLSLRADADYIYGLTNINQVGTTTASFRDLLFMLGINFGF